MGREDDRKGVTWQVRILLKLEEDVRVEMGGVPLTPLFLSLPLMAFLCLFACFALLLPFIYLDFLSSSLSTLFSVLSSYSLLRFLNFLPPSYSSLSSSISLLSFSSFLSFSFLLLLSDLSFLSSFVPLPSFPLSISTVPSCLPPSPRAVTRLSRGQTS